MAAAQSRKANRRCLAEIVKGLSDARFRLWAAVVAQRDVPTTNPYNLKHAPFGVILIIQKQTH